MLNKKAPQKSFDTAAQNEALINELKGSLFEYLVASSLAEKLGCQSSFLRDYSAESKAQLQDYEYWLRHNDTELLAALPNLASSVCSELFSQLPKQAATVLLVGKEKQNEDVAEADLVIVSDNREIPVSLKLCKKGAYVNTKSGGARSFFERYFKLITRASSLQTELNRSLDQSFDIMAHDLYENCGLTYKGEWDSAWTDAGLSELPGQLPAELNDIVLRHYSRVCKNIYMSVECMLDSDPELARQALLPLVGFGTTDLMQVTCFHGEEKSEGEKRRYALKSVQILKYDEVVKNVNRAQLGKWQNGLSSFELKMPDMDLQIRVKPMNKFTARAFKMNCSLRTRK